MEQVIERCAGLDVHKATVAACVRVATAGRTRRQEIRTFGTNTADLLAMRDWLSTHGVTHIAMEATGVYWKPIYYVLEDDFTLLLVNAAHVKQVPGRKTDVADCAWLAQFLEHGLLRSSFVPPRPIRDLRDLTRLRKCLIQERTRVANRLHKVLQDSGIKLSSVATDILGMSGRAMLSALMGGTTDPNLLAELARGRLRSKLPALRQALVGRFRTHHAFLVGRLLAHIDYLEESIIEISGRIAESLSPFATMLERLVSIPGVGRRTAEVLIAETGADMSRFPTAAHLSSWAGMCPGNDESAGKRRSGKTRRGNPWLRDALVEAGNAASHTKTTALAARYRRLMHRRGHRKAIVAVGRSILEISYYIFSRATTYQELGRDYFDAQHSERLKRHSVALLQRLGYRVTLVAAPA
jgi:transposase